MAIYFVAESHSPISSQSVIVTLGPAELSAPLPESPAG